MKQKKKQRKLNKTTSFHKGADLAHIFCTREAGLPIKSYSPDVIVHPTLVSTQNKGDGIEAAIEGYFIINLIVFTFKIYFYLFQATIKWYPALHTVVIGPGLGRDPIMGEYIPQLFEASGDKFLIADADFLYFMVQGIISEDQIKKKCSTLILTPNKAEFSRMWDKFIGSKEFQACKKNQSISLI